MHKRLRLQHVRLILGAIHCSFQGFYMKTLTLSAAMLALIGAGSLAGCSATAGDETQLAEGSDQRVVCRHIHEVGSRLSSRVCRTQAEWDEEASDAQRAMDEYEGTRGAPEPFLPSSG
jgi:hypothetical protein